MDFRPERDEEHPVRWEPAQLGEPDKWLSMADAVERLTRNGQGDPILTEQNLRDGMPLWTAFATYRYEPPASGIIMCVICQAPGATCEHSPIHA